MRPTHIPRLGVTFCPAGAVGNAFLVFFSQKMLIFAEFYTFFFEAGPAHCPLIAGGRQRAGPPAAPLRAATRQATAPARAAALRRPRPQRRALHGRAGVQGCGGGALPAAF